MPLETVAFIRYLSECDTAGQLSTIAQDDEIDEVNDNASLHGCQNTNAITTAADYAVSVDRDDDNVPLANRSLTSERYNKSELPLLRLRGISYCNICIDQCVFPCVKILSRNLGAPPVTSCLL